MLNLGLMESGGESCGELLGRLGHCGYVGHHEQGLSVEICVRGEAKLDNFLGSSFSVVDILHGRYSSS